jgi:hypothetical protein
MMFRFILASHATGEEEQKSFLHRRSLLFLRRRLRVNEQRKMRDKQDKAISLTTILCFAWPIPSPPPYPDALFYVHACKQRINCIIKLLRDKSVIKRVFIPVLGFEACLLRCLCGNLHKTMFPGSARLGSHKSIARESAFLTRTRDFLLF